MYNSVVSVISLLLSATLLLQAPTPTDDYAKMWDSVERAISGRYYARNTKKDQMQKLLAKYAPVAKAAKSRGEFSDAVNKMIDDFGDSHFDFFTPSDQGFYVMDALS